MWANIYQIVFPHHWAFENLVKRVWGRSLKGLHLDLLIVDQVPQYHVEITCIPLIVHNLKLVRFLHLHYLGYKAWFSKLCTNLFYAFKYLYFIPFLHRRLNFCVKYFLSASEYHISLLFIPLSERWQQQQVEMLFLVQKLISIFLY